MSDHGYLIRCEELANQKILSSELKAALTAWYSRYIKAAQSNGCSLELCDQILEEFLDLVVEQLQHPFSFEPFHKSLRFPKDYYHFGLEFTRPLVIWNQSKVLNLDQAESMVKQLKRKENVILLANHQTELDPQAISLLLEMTHPHLASEMVFVAGHRVTTDPIAVPFSKGINLLCIYSKRHIEEDLTKKSARVQQNMTTMKRLSELLSDGGCCIYIAPSGGRDRMDANGVVNVARFDPDSIALLSLTANSASKPTHFYPLALSTYDLLPPPKEVKREIGEARYTCATPISMAFGSEFDMERLTEPSLNKKQQRILRAQHIWEVVVELYKLL